MAVIVNTKTQKEILDFAVEKNRLDAEMLDFAMKLAMYVSYYRQNIHRFAEDFIGVKLKPFQKFLIYMLHQNSYSLLVMTRGIGKSWLIGLYACCLAILYPNSEIVIVSYTLRQAKNIVDKKILREICKKSPRLNYEIKKLHKADGNTIIEFKNGSTITPAVSSEASRGLRSTCIIIDESRLVNVDIIQSILQPTSHPRQANYMDIDEYEATKYPIEPSKDIYLTSAWYKVHALYRQFKSFLGQMIDGKQAVFTCAVSVDVALKNGLLDEERLAYIRSQPDMSQVRYSMEYLTLFYGESEDAFFNLRDINECQKLDFPYYCPSSMDYILKKYYKTNPKKLENEIRIISADIALRDGKVNDASAYILIRLIPNNENKYVRHIVGIETVEGGTSFDQSLRLKQLFEDFESDYIVLDTLGSGMAVYDSLIRDSIDNERGKTYKPMMSFNDEELKARCGVSDAIPCVYAIRGSLQVNHDCHVTVKDVIERNLIEFLIDIQDATNGALNEEYSLIGKTGEEQAFYMAHYLQTERLINEMINLTMEFKNGYVKLKESTSLARKDRYMALAYAMYFANILEQDLTQEDDGDSWGSFWN